MVEAKAIDRFLLMHDNVTSGVIIYLFFNDVEDIFVNTYLDSRMFLIMSDKFLTNYFQTAKFRTYNMEVVLRKPNTRLKLE